MTFHTTSDNFPPGRGHLKTPKCRGTENNTCKIMESPDLLAMIKSITMSNSGQYKCGKESQAGILAPIDIVLRKT
jgi:hypothetical protein